MTNEDWRHGGFGLYLHWPFCQSKCPYCDFNSHVAQNIDHDQWKRAYLTEIARVGKVTKGRVLQSVFFGGGTPSLMDPSLVEAIIEKVYETWPIANDIEITLEANPGSVEAARFKAYQLAGVNRISMGIQALNDKDLRRLGRLHSAEEARRALGVARDVFDRVSFDLIYGRQDQSLTDWQAELREATLMAADHLSLYQLTIEEGTVFGDRFARGLLKGLPEEGLSADMYLATQEICENAGLPAYEISNHARPGAESRHNLIYWNAGDYAGIGPGAHGRLTINGQRYAVEAPRGPSDWLKLVENGGVTEQCEIISGLEQATEYLIMGLRVRNGIDLQRYSKISGQSLNKKAINELIALNKISVHDGHLSATDEGRLILNAIISTLAP